MKKTFLLIIYILYFSNLSAQVTLSGMVTDHITHEPVAGATIYIPDLKAGTVTDSGGEFRLPGLPKTKLLVQVKFIGFQTISRVVNIAENIFVKFELEQASVEAGEVVVTGSPFTTDNSRTSLSVIPVESREISQSGNSNIAAALEKIPGLANISTGGAVGKPVIRGLGYNRIVTIQEGTRQEGQQWGDEHGLEIDEFSADRIEILKGPGSLMYGSDALGGVIHILEPVPPSPGKINTEIDSRYSFNGKTLVNSIMNEGHLKSFVWNARATLHNSSAYKTPEEYIYNSAFRQQAVNIMTGINRKWGFSHLHMSTYNDELGLINGERDSNYFFLDNNGNSVSNDEANSSTVNLPMQKVEHYKLSSVNSFFLGKRMLKINAAYQVNNRREFEVNKNDPTLFFNLKTLTAESRLYFEEHHGYETVVGISSMLQENTNKGIEFLVPDYKLTDAGVFTSLKKNYDKATWNVGVRYDYRMINAAALYREEEVLFNSFENNFSAISGSAGFTYQPAKKWTVKANFGKGFRSPNISELAANGVHEGTFRYEIGNAELKPENSLQGDIGILLNASKVTADLSAFYNLIDHFIYYRNFNNEQIEIDNKSFPVYRYIQGRSSLSGFEFTLDLHPVEVLHFENSASYVKGINEDTGRPLPFIPAFHIRNEITFNIKPKKESLLKEPFVTAGIDNFLKQEEIDQFETPTNGYSLLFAGMGTVIQLKKMKFRIYINGDNLLDKKYVSHLNRLKDAGILNQGRNVTIGGSVEF